MTSNLTSDGAVNADPQDTLFRVDETMHRPPDGYRLGDVDEWDPYTVDPDQIDDN